MSDLFPKESQEPISEGPEVQEEPEPVAEDLKEEGVKMEVGESENKEDESPFVEELEEKAKKKKRKVTEKQLQALAKAREKSKLKRMKLAEARNAKTNAEKEAKKKAAAEKRKAAAEKKAAELAEIDAFQIVKDKKYSFTKEELNELLDNTIDRHETKRKKRKEAEKLAMKPNVAQPYPYAPPPVAVPQPYPVYQHPAQPPPLSYQEMTREQIYESRKQKQSKRTNDLLNDFFNIK